MHLRDCGAVFLAPRGELSLLLLQSLLLFCCCLLLRRRTQHEACCLLAAAESSSMQQQESAIISMQQRAGAGSNTQQHGCSSKQQQVQQHAAADSSKCMLHVGLFCVVLRYRDRDSWILRVSLELLLGLLNKRGPSDTLLGALEGLSCLLRGPPKDGEIRRQLFDLCVCLRSQSLVSASFIHSVSFLFYHLLLICSTQQQLSPS